jgi:excinuclease ABC subunit C
VGLAEENDDIYRIGDKDPVILPKNSHALHLVQRIRNEAHRFAISYHRSLREKGSLHSVLNDIPGIGPKRVRELLKEFGSVAAIKDASLEELAKVKGMNTSVAKAVLDYLKN